MGATRELRHKKAHSPTNEDAKKKSPRGAKSPKKAPEASIPPPPALPDSPSTKDQRKSQGEAVRHQTATDNSEEQLPHRCWWKQLHHLKQHELISRLKEIQVAPSPHLQIPCIDSSPSDL